jgi:hypothetical protein
MAAQDNHNKLERHTENRRMHREKSATSAVDRRRDEIRGKRTHKEGGMLQKRGGSYVKSHELIGIDSHRR